MCGFAGVLEFRSGARPDEDALRRMGDSLVHRGPDEGAIYTDAPVGLVHRRLSIIDLAAGKQPMISESGAVAVVFNGEIYNYLELRGELEGAGARFRTNSDTEVLLSLYEHRGLDAFAQLNGMCACAIWDRRTHELVLARDRFGKKPLYYFVDGDRILFGSEIKALLAYGGIQRRVNPGAIHEFLTYGYVASEQTILEGVRRLPPAHALTVRNGIVRTSEYWRLDFTQRPSPPPEEEIVEQLSLLLKQAVQRRLMSEVPLGAFLSGGIDSSTVVALMQQLSSKPVRTFAVGFNESDFSELEDARMVAKHLGSDHSELIVKPNALEVLPKLAYHLDEPFGDSSAAPTYYVCEAARRHVTVALSGDAGDEVFAGYTRYRELGQYRRMNKVPRWAGAFLRRVTEATPFTWPAWNWARAVASVSGGRFPAAALGLFPYIQDRLYSPEFARAVSGTDPFAAASAFLARVSRLDPVSQYQYLDTMHYLPGDILTKVDRMSMANSLEVRSPLLDHNIVEYMASMPVSLKLRDGVSKYILRKAAGRWLPPSTLKKKKQGFGIPVSHWFRGELRGYAEEVLFDRRSLQRGYFSEKNLRCAMTQHTAGKRDYSTWIWCLIVLELWHRRFIDAA